MLMNYHEMTMGQPRDSPERRKQFLIICTVIAATFFHSVLMSGFFGAVEIKEGIFPGGEFVHRYTVRDVAATVGMWGTVGKTANVSTADYPDLMYSLYLDNPMDVSGGRQRFGTGLLLDKKGLEEKGQGLLDSNPSLEEEYAKMDETAKEDLTASARFKLLPWDSTTLPSVDAAVVQFPHTGGFVSALVSSYKVIPAILEYVKAKGEEGNVPVVLLTCNLREDMCTYYSPLLQGEKFLLGQPSPAEYMASLPEEKILDIEASWKNIKKYTPIGMFFNK